MEFRRLKYFVTIVEEGSISLAAKKLNMAQPPLSQQLKTLEDELNVSLFERQPRKLTLTDEGKFFYERCLSILELVDHTNDELQEFVNGVSGTLRVGSILSLGAALLPEKISYFRQHYPNVTFQVSEGDPNRMMELLEKRIIEIGIVRLPFNHEIFDHIPLQTDHYTALMTDDYAVGTSDEVDLKDLENLPIMILRRYTNTSSYNHSMYNAEVFRQACLDVGFEPSIICESSEIMTLLTWARAGIGIAIVPSSVYDLLPHRELHMKKIKNPVIQTQQAALIWLKNKQLSPPAKRFKALFEQ